MKKVLFLSSWFPNKQEPTNGNFVQRHAEAVALLQQVEVLHVMAVSDQKDAFLVEQQTIHGVFTVTVYFRQSSFSVLNLARKFQAYHKGYQNVHRPDLVHANVLQNNMFFAVYLKKKFKIPFVVSEHWSGFLAVNSAKLSALQLFTARIIAANATFVLPVSENLKKNLQKLKIGKNHLVIGNSVDNDLFSPKKKAEKKAYTFLHISNLVPLKNADKIILTAIKLHAEFQNFELQIGGDGNVNALHEIIEQHQAAHFITTFTALTPEEVAAKMQNADCFVLFSDYENLPCVLLESLACGTPVIATDVGGVSEIVNPSNGILINTVETELYKAMQAMLLGKCYPSEVISRDIALKYSKSEIARQFSQVYTLALQNTGTES